MSSRTRSILEELNQMSAAHSRQHVLESRGEHVINSAINLIEQIERYYDAETSKDLVNRLINSIRSRDSTKFSRGVRKSVIERKQGPRCD